MNTEPGPDNESFAEAEPTPAPRSAPARVVLINPYEAERRPWIQWQFFLWAPLFAFVVALLLYFFYPRACDDQIQVAYQLYNKYAPQFAQIRPAPPSAPAPVAAAPQPEADAAPAQVYSMDEIKQDVQQHIIETGLAQAGASFDWKRLEYTNPTSLFYELYAHLAQGQVALCMGTVVLDQHQHKLVITSQLVGS